MQALIKHFRSRQIFSWKINVNPNTSLCFWVLFFLVWDNFPYLLVHRQISSYFFKSPVQVHILCEIFPDIPRQDSSSFSLRHISIILICSFVRHLLCGCCQAKHNIILRLLHICFFLFVFRQYEALKDAFLACSTMPNSTQNALSKRLVNKYNLKWGRPPDYYYGAFRVMRITYWIGISF